MTSSSRRQRRRTGRSQQQRQQQRQNQRQQQRRQMLIEEQVDYTRDYLVVGHDLRRIVLWSSLLFACMFAAYFFI